LKVPIHVAAETLTTVSRETRTLVTLVLVHLQDNVRESRLKDLLLLLLLLLLVWRDFWYCGHYWPIVPEIKGLLEILIVDLCTHVSNISVLFTFTTNKSKYIVFTYDIIKISAVSSLKIHLQQQ
jgi:hypothetical protein